MDIALRVKPPTPPEEEPEVNLEAMDEDERKAYEKKKKKEEAEAAKKKKEEEEAIKAKEERAKKRAEAIENGQDLAELGLEESEEEIKIDDLPIDQLIPALDENEKMPFIGKFILVGFPQTEQHCEKLKEYGLHFDKVIFLNDTSEEEAGKKIAERFATADIAYDWEVENAKAQAQLAIIKEHISEEIVNEIDCTGSQDDVWIKIRTSIDPFFTLADDPENVRVSADNPEPEADDIEGLEQWKPLPRSDFGNYCPVTYVNQGWLMKGNPEFESTVHGKTFLFAGEKEQEEFKFNPTKFLLTATGKATLPLQCPAPKIMIVGNKGSGVTTQIAMLCEKYKLDSFEMAKEYLRKMNEEKNKRKRSRLLERGFKAIPPPEEGEEPEPDLEIEEDPDEFDKEAHEKELMQALMDVSKGLIIDGNWLNRMEEPPVATPINDLLVEARRMPEIIVRLECKEPATFKRCIDKDALQAAYDKSVVDRTEARKKARDIARPEKEAELRGEMASELKSEENEDGKTQEEIDAEVKEKMTEWETEQDEAEEGEDESDPLKTVEEMLEEHQTNLTNDRESD